MKIPSVPVSLQFLLSAAILSATNVSFPQAAEEVTGRFETRRYFIPPSFTGPPPESNAENRKSAQEVLELHGIKFPAGTNATYEPASASLTIRHTGASFAAIETVLKTMVTQPEKLIDIRAEIYELPAAEAQKIQESKADLADHQKQLEEVRRLVEKGEALLISSAEVTSISGERAQTNSGEELKVLKEYEWNDKAAAMVPKFVDARTGTTLEIDPILGADDRRVDLNYSLEHLTEAPEPRVAELFFPGGTEARKVSFTRIHRAKITTQLTMKVGTTRMIGIFNPIQEKPPGDNHKLWIAFLSFDLQATGPALEYELIPEDSGKKE